MGGDVETEGRRWTESPSSVCSEGGGTAEASLLGTRGAAESSARGCRRTVKAGIRSAETAWCKAEAR